MIQAGIGRVRVNGRPIELMEPEAARYVITTPLILSGELRNLVDIDIKVSGGGFMGQAEATATAISKSMVKWFAAFKPSPNIDLRTRFLSYSKVLLAGDPRRKEPKKAGRVGARRRRQKSYR